MVRSRLPVPSLLGLFAALLMLPPEMLMDKTEDFQDVPLFEPGVQNVLAEAVRLYNQYHATSKYFKILRVLSAKLKAEDSSSYDYLVKLEMISTNCRMGMNEQYKAIQRCNTDYGDQTKQFVEFRLTASFEYDTNVHNLG